MEIVWSKLAYEHFLEILIYVENNFGMLTAQKTRQKIVQVFTTDYYSIFYR